MADRLTEVYYGDGFDYSQDHPWDMVHVWLGEGSVGERRMPTPTKKNPDKYRTVYLWLGEKTQELRDLSAEMPPRATELAAYGGENGSGSRMHKAFAFSYRGIMMGNASRPVMVPA